MDMKLCKLIRTVCAVLGTVGLSASAVAEVTDYWLFDSAAGTITDGNWTIKVFKSDGNRLNVGTSAGADVVQNAYVEGAGLLDLSKPIYEGSRAGQEWLGFYIYPGAFNQCSHITGIKIGGHRWTKINGRAFYKCDNVTELEVDSDTLEKLEYNALGPLGSASCRVVVKKFRAPNLTALDYGPIGNIYHVAEGSAGEHLYLPKVKSLGGAAVCGVYITGIGSQGWAGALRFPSVESVGYQSQMQNNHANVIELGRGTLKSVGHSTFNVSTLDSIIFGHGDNELNLATNIFRYTTVKSLYFNGRRPVFPSGDVKWWNDHDSFSARNVRMVIPRGDDTWADLIAEAQKAENKPTASELTAYRSRYPNCQDPIGKVPGSFFGIENEQFLSYGCSDAKLRDLYIASTVPVAVPGTEPAANVWPTAGKWFEASDVQTVSAPADWTLAEDGFFYRALGYVYERATDEGWQVVSTNYATSAEISFETLGAQRVTWLFERGVGGDRNEARQSDELPTDDIIKCGSGTARFYGTSPVAPQSLRIDAGTLAFGGFQTTNHFFRFVFKKMSSGSDFRLCQIRFTDENGDVTSGIGYADAAADCLPAGMAAKSVWISRQDYSVDDTPSYKERKPSCLFDGNTWSNVRIKGLVLKPADSSTWVTIVVRLPATAGMTAGYNFNRGYSGDCVTAWTLETSPDGVNWTLVDTKKDVTKPADSQQWYNGGIDWPVNAGDVPGGAGIAATTPVQVKSGATFDGSGVGTDGQELAALFVDYAELGVGTLMGVRLAAAGTLDVVNVPEKTRLGGFDVPLAFVGGAFPSDFAGWTVRVNGQPSRYSLTGANGKLTLLAPGMVLLLR